MPCFPLIDMPLIDKFPYRPLYVKGTAIGCGVTGLIVPLALFLHLMLEVENRKRDRLYGPASPTNEINVSVSGDAHQSFRYFT